MKENIIIRHEHVILCEGMDEQRFLISYFNSDRLKSIHSGFSDNIDIFDFGGNSQLSQFLEVVRRTPGFSHVKSVLIIRDAEADARKAISEIAKALRDNLLPVPDSPCQWCGETLKVSFLLFPSCSEYLENGTLEDLCLKLLKKKEPIDILEKIDSFLDALEQESKVHFPRRFKNKLHTYFSVSDKFVSMKIGEAAKANAFDWESPILDPFRKHLLEVL